MAAILFRGDALIKGQGQGSQATGTAIDLFQDSRKL